MKYVVIAIGLCLAFATPAAAQGTSQSKRYLDIPARQDPVFTAPESCGGARIVGGLVGAIVGGWIGYEIATHYGSGSEDPGLGGMLLGGGVGGLGGVLIGGSGCSGPDEENRLQKYLQSRQYRAVPELLPFDSVISPSSIVLRSRSVIH